MRKKLTKVSKQTRYWRFSNWFHTSSQAFSWKLPATPWSPRTHRGKEQEKWQLHKKTRKMSRSNIIVMYCSSSQELTSSIKVKRKYIIDYKLKYLTLVFMVAYSSSSQFRSFIYFRISVKMWRFQTYHSFWERFLAISCRSFERPSIFMKCLKDANFDKFWMK